MKLLCITLLFLCTSAMAEVDDNENRRLPGDAFIHPIPRLINPRPDCKITCQDAHDVHVEYEGPDAVIDGCGDGFDVECKIE